MRTIPAIRYLQLIRRLGCATSRLLRLVLTGSEARHKRTEVVLPRLERKGSVRSMWFRGRKVYFPANRPPQNLTHDLAVAEALVRIAISRPDAVLLPQRSLHLNGSVPDGGIYFTVCDVRLYLEFSTLDNAKRTHVLKAKITNYRKHLGDDAIVLFLLDTSRERVCRLVDRLKPLDGEFRFSDWDTFRALPLGEALEHPIYLWGQDGQSYPLGE